MGELDLVPVCFLQLVGKRYPLKAIRTLGEKKKGGGLKRSGRRRKFRKNLLESMRPFPEPIQFFVLGASLSYWKPPKTGAYQPEERL